MLRTRTSIASRIFEIVMIGIATLLVNLAILAMVIVGFNQFIAGVVFTVFNAEAYDCLRYELSRWQTEDALWEQE